MDVTGLNNNRYLINNPIWVDISNIDPAAIYVRVTIEPTSYLPPNLPKSLRLHPYNGKLYFDLSEGVKTFFRLPDFSDETPSGDPIDTNYETIRIKLDAMDIEGLVISAVQYTKVFIRGGQDGLGVNVALALGDMLRESDKIPRWAAYPVRKYYFGAGNQIRSTTNVPADESEVRRVVGRNPIYLKFLNSLGTYSYWLFEKWGTDKDVKAEDPITTRYINYSLGAEVGLSLNVEGRVERAYYKTMRALSESPEIYVLDLDDKMFNDAESVVSSSGGINISDWGRVFGTKNKLSFENSVDVQDFKFTFTVLTKKRPTLKW